MSNIDKYLTPWQKSENKYSPNTFFIYRISNFNETIAIIDKSNYIGDGWFWKIYKYDENNYYSHNYPLLQGAINDCNRRLKHIGFEILSRERFGALQLLI